jgi:CHASE2 domain-containing sensor protein
VIAIDEATLQHYGQFPLSRDRYATLLEQLAFVQPAAIGIDLLLTDPSPQDQHPRPPDLPKWQRSASGRQSAPDVKAPHCPGHSADGPGFVLGGHSNYSPDIDGISRQVSLYQGETPALALALTEMYQVNVDQHRLQPRMELPPSRTISPSPDERPAATSVVTINWPGEVSPHDDHQRGKLNVYSMVDVMESRVALEVFQNQIVLVGLATSGTGGIRSPLNREPPVAGVIFHAAIVDNLLNQRWLIPLPPWALPPLLVALGLLASLSFPPQRLRHQVLLMLVLSAGWLGIVVLAFASNLWLPIVAPSAP